MAKKACKNCRALYQGDKCPNCGSDNSTESWKGRVAILDSENSKIAKNLKLEKKGTYAIKAK
jgi:RNA polymerase subunit RPABC4/transcription elongation factor Spt4